MTTDLAPAATAAAPAVLPRRRGRSWLPRTAAALLVGVVAAVRWVDGGSLALDRALALRPVGGVGGHLAALLALAGTGPVLYPLLAALALRRRARGTAGWWWPVVALGATQVLGDVLSAGLQRPATAGAAFPSSVGSGPAAAATLGWGLLVLGLSAPWRRELAGEVGRWSPGRRAAAAAVAMGLLVGGCRLLLGADRGTDVLAGIAFGLLALCAATAVEDRLAPRAPRPAPAPAPRSSARWWCVPGGIALVQVGMLVATPAAERLKDLLVYQGAAGVAGSGGDVYAFRTVFDMPFTYPPFAALLAEPLGRMPVGVGQVLWTAGTLAALVPLARVALAPVVARLGLPLTVAALLLASPVRSHLRFGQVGVLLVLVVAADLLHEPRGRTRGLGLGLAIAVKLTPAVFLPWLALTGARSRLRWTLLWLGGASLAGLVLLWPSSVAYLTSASRDTTRFGPNDVPGNQSVRGMLLRSALPDHLVAPVWLVLALLLVAVGTLGAVRLERQGQRLAAVGVLAALSVAVSPISWVHHLVWLTLPIAALAAVGRWRLVVAWWVLLLPGLPALGARLDGSLVGTVVTDLQGLTAVAAVVLLPSLVQRSSPAVPDGASRPEHVAGGR